MRIIAILTALTLMSCLHSGFDMDGEPRYVDPLLRPYLEKFKEEASKRGYNLNTDDITMAFHSFKSEVAGRANWYKRYIIIDSTSLDWKAGNGEQLVFHELGHLLLRRSHDDSRVNYLPKSIMASKSDPWYINGYEYRRDYYIDELFNPSTPPADWFFDPEKTVQIR